MSDAIAECLELVDSDALQPEHQDGAASALRLRKLLVQIHDMWIAAQCATGGSSVEEARLIMDEFVKDGAPSCVNLGNKTRRAVEAAFNAGEIDAALFSGAEKDIVKMTTKDAFARFKKSDGFQELLLAIGAYKSRNERAGVTPRSQGL